MHAFCIVGKTQEERQKEIEKRIASWRISSWDTINLTIDTATVGIEHIRDFQRAMTLTPQNSPAKVGVLWGIHRLTPEAQNALLKTLEEPPPNTYILGETATPDMLLPTILSRFSLVHIGAMQSVNQDTIREYEKILMQLGSSTPGQKLQILEQYTKTREDAKLFIENALYALQHLLHADNNATLPPQKITPLIRKLFDAQRQLSVNVNPKLVLDNAIL